MSDDTLFAGDEVRVMTSPEQIAYGPLYVETFLAPAGRLVLGHMAEMVLGRPLPADCSEAALREIEGQRRHLRETVMMIERQRNPTHPRGFVSALIAILADRD
jgi:hypothetical protein